MRPTRGGRQRIPRPDDARLGDPPPWHGLRESERRFTLAEVRARVATMGDGRPALPAHPDSRPAAVLMPFFEEDGDTHVILTKRPDTMPTHQGEIAFPGGRHDAEDADLLATALRESDEEIGLAPSDVEVVARLDGLATVGSRFTITPFVGLLSGRPTLAPDAREVVKVIEVPISELLDPQHFREEIWSVRAPSAPELHVAFYELDGETVWGATARILTGFLSHLVRPRLAGRTVD